MIDQNENGGQTVYYNILEADEQGRDPDHNSFESNSKSGLHKIAKIGNKASVLFYTFRGFKVFFVYIYTT